jgi:hypothetical protein
MPDDADYKNIGVHVNHIIHSFEKLLYFPLDIEAIPDKN